MSPDTLLHYQIGEGVEAFSTRTDSTIPYPVITAHQVHDTKIEVIDRPDISRDELQGHDALITRLRGVAIGVRTADCVPILLYSPDKEVIAAVHAGWKGTVQRITQKVVTQMVRSFGCDPSGIRAVLGSAIAPESFQVGEEVVTYFKGQGFPLERIWFFNEGEGESPMYHGHHIDLWDANRWLLSQSGIPEGNIQVTEIDTYTDKSFFSARREGIQCGRIISAIKLA